MFCHVYKYILAHKHIRIANRNSNRCDKDTHKNIIEKLYTMAKMNTTTTRKKTRTEAERGRTEKAKQAIEKSACTHIHPETYTQLLSAKTACSYLLVMLQPENTYSLYIVHTYKVYRFYSCISFSLLLFHFICIQF